MNIQRTMVAAVIFLSLSAHNVHASEKCVVAQGRQDKQLAMRFRCYLYQLTMIDKREQNTYGFSTMAADYKTFLYHGKLERSLGEKYIRINFANVGLLNDKDGKVSIPDDVQQAFDAFGPNNSEFQSLGVESDAKRPKHNHNVF